MRSAICLRRGGPACAPPAMLAAGVCTALAKRGWCRCAVTDAVEPAALPSAAGVALRFVRTHAARLPRDHEGTGFPKAGGEVIQERVADACADGWAVTGRDPAHPESERRELGLLGLDLAAHNGRKLGGSLRSLAMNNVGALFAEFEGKLPQARTVAVQRKLDNLRKKMDAAALALVHQPDDRLDKAELARFAALFEKIRSLALQHPDEDRRLDLIRALKDGSASLPPRAPPVSKPQPKKDLHRVSVHLAVLPRLPKLKPAGVRLADDFFTSQICDYVTSTADGMSLKIPPGTVGRLPTVAFLGRSNAGKSSLLNALLNRRSLARTSRAPGCTKTVNLFSLGNAAFLVDMPGYGERSRSEWGEAVMNYLTKSKNLRQCYLLIDVEKGLCDDDENMLQILEKSDLPYLVVLTKVDKCKPAQLERARVRLYEGLFQRQCPNWQREDFERATQAQADLFLPPVMNSSAVSRVGISDLRFDLLVRCGVASDEGAYEDEDCGAPASTGTGLEEEEAVQAHP